VDAQPTRLAYDTMDGSVSLAMEHWMLSDNMDTEGSDQIRHSQIRVEISSESDRPNDETQRYVICESLVQHMFYVLRRELAHVLGTVTDLLWADQTLLRDWVVTKVAFGLVQTHAARHGRAR
jgi:hypothetical protein